MTALRSRSTGHSGVKRCTAILFIFMAAPAAAWGATAAELVARLPKSTCFVLSTENVHESAEAFTKSKIGEAITGENFGPLRAELASSDTASALNLAPAFGLSWRDLADVAGPAALVAVSKPDHTLAWAIVFPAGGQAEKSKLTKMADAAIRKQGFSTESATDAWTIYRRKGAAAEEIVLFETTDTCGIATSRDFYFALTASKGDSKSDAQATPKPDLEAAPADIGLLVRPMELWEGLRTVDSSAKKPKNDPVASARRLGFGGVSTINATFHAPSKASVPWRIDVHAAVKAPLEKALRLLSLEPGELPPAPNWLGDNFAAAWLFRLDCTAAMKGYGNLYDESNQPGPDGEGLFDDVLSGLRDDPEGVKVDLRKDVFEQLGPQGVRVDYDNGWVYQIETKDEARLLAALTRFYKGDKRVTHGRIGEHDAWSVAPGASLFVEGENKSGPSIRAVAVGRKQALIADTPERLRTALEPAKATQAAGDRLWQELAKVTGREDGAIGVARLDRLLAPSYRRAIQLKQKEPDDVLTGLWRRVLLGGDRPAQRLLEKLPPYEKISGALPTATVRVAPPREGASDFTLHVDPK